MCVCVWMCAHSAVAADARRRYRCLGAGVTEHCELPSTGTGKNSGSPQEQYTLITIKPSAQPNLCSVYALPSQEARGEEKEGLGSPQKMLLALLT